MGRKPNIKYGVTPKIYEKGEYRGYTYYIVESYFCPLAYVTIPKGRLFHRHPLYKLDYRDLYFIPVHGGITYKQNRLPRCIYDEEFDKKCFVIGWHYAHAGDYLYADPECLSCIDCACNSSEDHKYTYSEIIADVKDVIDCIKGAFDEDA